MGKRRFTRLPRGSASSNARLMQSMNGSHVTLPIFRLPSLFPNATCADPGNLRMTQLLDPVIHKIREERKNANVFTAMGKSS